MIKLNYEDFMEIVRDRGLIVFYTYKGNEEWILYAKSDLEIYTVVVTADFTKLKAEAETGALRLVQMLNNPTPEEVGEDAPN